MSDATLPRQRRRLPDGSVLAKHFHSDPRRRLDISTRKLAEGLGWFSIALGFTEVACNAAIARWLGMPRAASLIRAYGARELLQGVGILSARDPTPWISARVAGDVLDIATVLPGLTGRGAHRDNVSIALVALAGVTALDILCARALSEAALAPSEQVRREYRRRSGFSGRADAMRGAARDFRPPSDITGPEAMRPWTHGSTKAKK